jgi:Methyltransferase domain
MLAIAPWLHRAAAPLNEWNRLRARRRRDRDGERRIAALQSRLAQAGLPDGQYRVALADLCPELDRICKGLRPFNDEIPVADIDQDGFLCPRLGAIWPAPSVSKEAFVQRIRFDLAVVDRHGQLGVRKDYRGDRIAFVNELEATLDLTAAGCQVPAVLALDFDRPSITFAYIHGQVVRETLAAAGARIRDRDVTPTRSRFAKRRQDRQRVLAGRRVLDQVLDAAIIPRIGDALLAIHRSGYALNDVKYGNVIIEARSKLPYFVDLEEALRLRELPHVAATYLRDRDAEKLNELFGTSLLTAKTLRATRTIPGGTIYSPFYVGAGIKWGPIWHRDVGTQRWWHMLAKHLPVPRGGRILDLGANNGFNALQMLRAGASEVVGVEINPAAIEQGLFVKRMFEWADNRAYRFSYVCGSAADIGSMALGRFDLVTALCSLYYMDIDDMAKTISEAAKLTDTLVLQCNDDQSVERHDPATYMKASLSFSVELARSNGFPDVTLIHQRGSARPLVIAHSEKVETSMPPERAVPKPAKALWRPAG